MAFDGGALGVVGADGVGEGWWVLDDEVAWRVCNCERGCNGLGRGGMLVGDLITGYYD